MVLRGRAVPMAVSKSKPGQAGGRETGGGGDQQLVADDVAGVVARSSALRQFNCKPIAPSRWNVGGSSSDCGEDRAILCWDKGETRDRVL